MRFGDPPLAGDSINSISDAREIAEEFSRKMSRPLLPRWRKQSDHPCRCFASYHHSEFIMKHQVPYGPMLHLMQCDRCGHFWKKTLPGQVY